MVESENMAAGGKGGSETKAAVAKVSEKQKKDVKSWEQTQRFIENKWVSGFQGKKQTGSLVEKPSNKPKNGAQKAEFRGWKSVK